MLQGGRTDAAVGCCSVAPTGAARWRGPHDKLAVLGLVELLAVGPVGLPALPLGLGAPVQLDGLEGEGQPSTMGSGRRTATVEVARAPTWSASHREAPSRAVKCLKTTPGWGRASRGVTLH